MSQEIKYTTDGKKVIVVGNLNAQEKIVQEIFVSENGAEIPSGENFVVKSLHDKPVMPWKEKRLNELEESYNRSREQWESKLKNLRGSYESKCKLLEDKLNFIGAAMKEAAPDAFELLVNYVCGRVTHVITGSKWYPTIKELDAALEANEYGLKLLSFYGRENGSLKLGLCRYSDGSGGYETVIPCNSYAEAVETLKGLILSNPINDSSLKEAKKHGIEIPSDMLQDYKERRTKEIEKSVSNFQAQIDKSHQEIESIKSL